MFKTRETALKHIKKGANFWTQPFGLFHEDREMIFQAACEVCYLPEFEHRARDWLWDESFAVAVLEERVKRGSSIESKFLKYLPEATLRKHRAYLLDNMREASKYTASELVAYYCDEAISGCLEGKMLPDLDKLDYINLLRKGIGYQDLPLQAKRNEQVALFYIQIHGHIRNAQLPLCLRSSESFLLKALEVADPHLLVKFFNYPLRRFLALSNNPIEELTAKLMAHELDAQLSVKVEVKKTQKI